MTVLRFTILGCGSSGGVPRLGDIWGACDPANPKNRRRRCSLLVERIGAEGTTRVLIDSGPDMRQQLLDAGVGLLDGVVYTHAHADHVHGLDDLRMIVFNRGARLPVWADGATQDALLSRFGYAFVQPPGSAYPPILDLRGIDGPVRVEGTGGAVALIPFRVHHGRIAALGFRIGGLAYLPDVSEMTDEAWAAVADLDCLGDRRAALQATPDPCASGTHAGMDRPGAAPARGADQHACRSRPCPGRGRNPRSRDPGP
jgi:phosphoribosyl 1,2-cyclic phosphate phosphodiesterase